LDLSRTGRFDAKPDRRGNGKYNNQAGENSDQTNQHVNDCVDVQYHALATTSILRRNVTSSFGLKWRKSSFCWRWWNREKADR